MTATILGKVRACFLADMTFIATTEEKQIPNPTAGFDKGSQLYAQPQLAEYRELGRARGTAQTRV